MVDCAIQIENESCLNACIFCKPDGFKKSDKKNISEVAVSIYKQALNLRKHGFTDVELSGHDPLQFEKIVGFIVWLRKIGFKKITLATHGRNLCDAILTKKLNDAGLNFISIPLYGSNSKIHDAITQSSGSFNETIKGITNIKRYASSIQITLHTLIMNENITDLNKIIKLFSTFTPSYVQIRMPYISNSLFEKYSAISLSKLQQNVTKLFKLCEEVFGNRFSFGEIPYCIFGFYDSRIIHFSVPIMANNYSVPKKYQTNLHGIPKYRLKKKIKICKICKYNIQCEGFLNDYIEHFNLEYDCKLKPL